MWKRIRLLTDVQLRESFGWNAAKYGRDKKEKRHLRLIAAASAIVAVILVGYVALFSFAFVQLGAEEIIPPYIFSISSLVVLFYTLFKAGDTVFNMRTYERLAALPVSRDEIVASRLLTVYVFNVAMCALVMAAGNAVYAAEVKPGFSFYFFTVVGTVLLPVLPMTVATAAGAAITAVSVRMKHRNAVSVVLSIVLVVVVLVLPTALAYGGKDVTVVQIGNLAKIVMAQLTRMYPPVALYDSAAVGGSWPAFAGFAGVTLAVFVLFMAVMRRCFLSVCTALSASPAKGNYVLHRLTERTPLSALYRKELRRYFASPIYVMNTGVGYIMMLLFSAAAAFAGKEQFEAMFGSYDLIISIMPMLLALMCCVSVPTACSISMEGKQWWIAKSLPITAKTLFDSKILVNLTVAAPFYILSEVLLLASLGINGIDTLWLVIVPFIFVIFTAVLGITVNLRLPLFEWDSETVVVKQSMAVLVFMLAGFLCGGLPLAALFALPETARGLVYPATAILFSAASVWLYRSNNARKLNEIG